MADETDQQFELASWRLKFLASLSRAFRFKLEPLILDCLPSCVKDARAAFFDTRKLNDADPRAWLAHALAKLSDHPANRIDESPPWNWKAAQ
jgi:hypothetical protein